MATATIPTNDPDEIRRQMAQIRQHLRQDVKAVYAGAEAASDWKHYVKLYPWAALGLTFGLGFLIVPRKRRSVTQTAEKAAEAAIAKVVESVEKPASKEKEKEKEKKGWMGTIFALAAPFVVRSAQSYALSYLENFLAQQAQSATKAPQDTPR